MESQPQDPEFSNTISVESQPQNREFSNSQIQYLWKVSLKILNQADYNSFSDLFSVHQ